MSMLRAGSSSVARSRRGATRSPGTASGSPLRRPRLLDEVVALVDRLPIDPIEAARLRDKAVGLANECGCELSGFALVAALVLSGIYLAASGNVGVAPVAALFVGTLAAGMLGKAIGIAVARLRLRLLGRSLQRQLLG